MNNFPNNPDFCLQWDWKNLRNLNCFVNIFCWFFFEVKKKSWQKFSSMEPQIYMFTQLWMLIHSWISISTNIHHAVFQPMFCNITSLESSFSHCVYSFLLMLCDYYWFFQSSNYKDMMRAIKNFFYNVMFNVLMGDKPVYEYVSHFIL